MSAARAAELRRGGHRSERVEPVGVQPVEIVRPRSPLRSRESFPGRAGVYLAGHAAKIELLRRVHRDGERRGIVFLPRAEIFELSLRKGVCVFIVAQRVPCKRSVGLRRGRRAAEREDPCRGESRAEDRGDE